MQPPAGFCTRTTRRHRPCRNPAMTTGGVCATHNGPAAAATPAQREAARSNGGHGIFDEGFRDGDERALYVSVLTGEVAPVELRRQTLAVLALRASRAVAWEGKAEQLSPVAEGALRELLKALPPQADDGPRPLEEWEIVQKVEQAIDDNAEVLLQRLFKDLTPEAEEELRAQMREKGVLRA